MEGKASAEECRVATHAAHATAAYAAAYATRAANAAYAAYAANATYATVYAAHAAHAASAGKPHLIEAQWDYYQELLHFDDIAEKALLGEIV